MFDLVIFLDGFHYMRTSLKDGRDGRDGDEVRLGNFQDFIVLRVLRILKVNGLVLYTVRGEDIGSFLDLVDLIDLTDLIGLKMWAFLDLNRLKFPFRFGLDGFDELGGAV